MLRQLAGQGGGVADEGVGGDFDLQAADAGADEDVREMKAGVVNESGEILFHSDGGTAAPDVAGDGEQLFHGN